MKIYLKLLILISITILSASVLGAEKSFDTYMKSFNYDERDEMKVKVKEALELYKNGKAVFLDIRFPEETKFVSFSLAQKIPLNELPNRLNELDKSKVIITFCPHYDRAELARTYLTMKGYHSRYLIEGLPGILDQLRGDGARDFDKEITKEK